MDNKELKQQEAQDFAKLLQEIEKIQLNEQRNYRINKKIQNIEKSFASADPTLGLSNLSLVKETPNYQPTLNFPFPKLNVNSQPFVPNVGPTTKKFDALNTSIWSPIANNGAGGLNQTTWNPNMPKVDINVHGKSLFKERSKSYSFLETISKPKENTLKKNELEFPYILRMLLSNKEANVLSGGKLKKIKDSTCINTNLSKPVIGMNDRLLCLTGKVDQIAKAVSMISNCWVDNDSTNILTIKDESFQRKLTRSHTFVRLLIIHDVVGKIIGSDGSQVKRIENKSGAKVIAFKGLLPLSDERLVELHGNANRIQIAMNYIGKSLVENRERNSNITLYPFDWKSGKSILNEPMEKREPIYPYPGEEFHPPSNIINNNSNNISNNIKSIHYRSISQPNLKYSLNQSMMIVEKVLVVPMEIISILIEKSMLDINKLFNQKDSLLNIRYIKKDDKNFEIVIKGSQYYCDRAEEVFRSYLQIINSTIEPIIIE